MDNLREKLDKILGVDSSPRTPDEFTAKEMAAAYGIDLRVAQTRLDRGVREGRLVCRKVLGIKPYLYKETDVPGPGR